LSREGIVCFESGTTEISDDLEGTEERWTLNLVKPHRLAILA